MIDKKILKKLHRICGKDGVMTNQRDLLLYQYDASVDTALPDAVVLPTSAEQISQIVMLANEAGLPLIARGSGSNLSGGTIPQFGGIIISFSKMNRILEVDLENRCAVVEAGVFNLDLQNVLAPMGYYFAPDPASQRISTIGGNIAENAGGPHCLKYGVTANHVMGIEAVLADGSIVEFGGKHEDDPGYDVAGLLVGSEGALAIITKATVRINVVTEAVKTMLAIFDDMKKAANAVTDIISKGIVPASLEMMDKPIIQTIEKAHKLGYPSDADAVLVIEVDGPGISTEQEAARIIDLCEKNGVKEVRIAKDDRERDDLWKGRRLSFGTLTQLRPSIMIADGTVPRTKLPEVLDEVIKICKKFDLNVGNVFHAGDGNLHPFIVYDERDAEEKARVFRATEEILQVCVDAGGTISGEHGIGIEKKEAMKMLFTEADFDVMRRVKRAFDPDNMLNPNKIIPVTEMDNL